MNNELYGGVLKRRYVIPVAICKNNIFFDDVKNTFQL